MDKRELAELRRNFSSKGLSKADVDPSPFIQFDRWMNDALVSDVIDANAMTLSTVGQEGKPTSRVVLLKFYGEDGFAFFTNYGSRKGRDLEANPNAALHFFWPQLDRQVAINGSVEETSREESGNYFNSRPVESRIGAWASEQSREINSREALEEKFRRLQEKFGDEVPLPDFWGGYRLIPNRFEFWQGRQNRLHDRICYSLENAVWQISRLSP